MSQCDPKSKLWVGFWQIVHSKCDGWALLGMAQAHVTSNVYAHFSLEVLPFYWFNSRPIRLNLAPIGCSGEESAGPASARVLGENKLNLWGYLEMNVD